jgi:hypothetical protein
MDILDDGFGAEPQPVQDMSSLVETRPLGSYVPPSAVRNRAATTAILTSTPTDMVEKYRLMVKEEDEGSDVTYQQAAQSLAGQNKNANMKHVISILGDNTVPLDQKKKLMSFVQNGQFKEEPAVTLQTQALIAPSKGETPNGESARISLSTTLGEMQAERENRQRLINGLIASAPDTGLPQQVGELAQTEVMPFGRNVIASRVAANINTKEEIPNTIGGFIKNFLLPGSTKGNIQDKLANIPPENREAFTKSILASIKESASVFPSDNYYAQYKTAVELLDSPKSSTSARWTENIMTLMDAFWVKGMVSGANAAKAAKAEGVAGEKIHKADWELVDDPVNPFNKNTVPTNKLLAGPVEDTAKRIQLNSVVHREHPASPYSVVEQANPEQARSFHTAIVEGTDEVAQAIAGTDREQAIINNTYPQMATESNIVLNKVNQEITEAVSNTGATRYTPEEFEGAVANVINDFRNASGLSINDAMTTFREDGDHLFISAHYSTPGGAFITPEAAKAQAQYALKGYGIKDSEISIMQRNGLDYIPATGNAPGDYIVRVETKHPISDSDVVGWNPLDVKKNWTDRIAQTGSENRGNVSGWLFDPGSIFHPTLTGSASIASDQSIVLENLLLKPIRDLRNEMGAFPQKRLAAIEDYMREANEKGIKLDAFNLTSRGFSQPEIDALSKWKDIWDGHYYLENFDMVRTLNSQGYELFENANTRLFAKKVAKNSTIGRVYDPATDTAIHLNQATLDSLYNQGGYYAALRRPIDVNGITVEHMMVRNTPSEFLRGIRDTDHILNYRDGYFTVNYKKGSRFVDEIYKDAAGVEKRRTVAVADNTKDAQMFANTQQANTGNRHEIREDSRGFKKDGDGYWDLHSASGRIAQRRRGQPLQTPVGINQLGTGVHIDNPMESAIRSAKSLAGRTVSRPMLETAERRFVSQYERMLPSDGMGGKRFPNDRSEIVDHVSHTSKDVADARSTYGYIRYLQNGYINSADEVFKGGMNIMADILGKYGISKGEKIARSISDISPSHLSKGTVFHAYISMSLPIRQWIVQAHQAGRMAAYNPKGFLNGGVAERMGGYLGISADVIKGSQVAQDFTKFVNDSGMVAGVDRNSLVRGLGLSMADSSSNFKNIVGAIASVPQRIGFDIGEKVNMLGHLAAVHEKYTREGINLANKTNRDLAFTEARALSYDLNKAGELAYTQSSPAMLLQFLQMPHKALLQAVNRKLGWQEKARMFAWDMIMYGAPSGLIGSLMLIGGAGEDGVLPSNPELRDIYTSGLEALLINKALTNLDDSGEKTRIDFSALSPYDLDGWARMYSAFMEHGPSAAFAASPAGQVMAMNGVNGARKTGRIPQAFLTLGRFFNVVPEIDKEDPTKFSAVISDVAKITSGWSAASNALIMLETRKKRDSMGVAVDSSVTLPEVGAAFLGFGTKSTKELYEISKNRSDEKKKHDEDVMNRYRDIVTYYSNALNTDNADVEHITKVSSMLMKTFDNPYDLALVSKQWQNDLVGKESQLFKKMVDASTMPNANKLMDDIKTWPVDQATRDLLIQRLKDAKATSAYNQGIK